MEKDRYTLCIRKKLIVVRVLRNGFKVEKDRFTLCIRKTFTIVRVLRHWNRLSGQVLGMEVFKDRLTWVPNNLV